MSVVTPGPAASRDGVRGVRVHVVGTRGQVGGERARAPGWRGGLVALAAGEALLTAALGAGCGFYYDDFWNLDQAHRLGWGWGFVGRPVFGHVTPLANVLIGLVAGPGGGRWPVAMGMLVLLAAAVPVACALAARALGAAERPAVAAGLLAGTGASLAAAGTWWSVGLNLYPAIVAGAAIVGGYGMARSGRRAGLPVAVGGLTVGLALTEGMAVVLLVPAVLALLGPGSGGLLGRLRHAWGPPRRWFWFALPMAGALVVRASAAAPVEQYPRSPIPSTLAFAPLFLVRGFVPSLVGLTAGRVELAGSPVLTTLVGAAAVVAVGLVLSRRLAPLTAGPALVAVVVVVLARGVLVAWSRLALLGWDAAVEVRYWLDLLWLVPVLLAPAWTGATAGAGAPRPAPSAPRSGSTQPLDQPPSVLDPDRPGVPTGAGAGAAAGGSGSASTARRPSAAALALAGLVVAGLAGQVAVAAQAPSRTSRRYQDEARSSWADRPVGAVALDTMVPASVLGPQFGAATFLSATLARAHVPLDFGPGDNLVAPDPAGRFRAVTLGPLTTLDLAAAFTAVGAPGVAHEGACWVAGPEGALVWVPLARPLTLGPYVVDLRLTGPSDPRVALLAAGTVPAAYLAASGVGRGEDRWLVASTPFQATQLGFEIPADGRLCLAAATVSLPVADR